MECLYYVILLFMTHLREQWQDNSMILGLFAMPESLTAILQHKHNPPLYQHKTMY